MLRGAPATVLVLAAVFVAGCGSSSSTSSSTASSQAAATPAPSSTGQAVPPPPVPTSTTQTPVIPTPSNPLGIPKGVPRTASKLASDAEQKPVLTWLSSLTAGDFPTAADQFADGAKVQNGTPVLTLHSERDRLGWVQSFPCGAQLTDARDAGRGYLVLTYELQDRKGSSCGSGRGLTAAGVVRVQGGKMTEWYRLPDPPASYDPDGPGNTV